MGMGRVVLMAGFGFLHLWGGWNYRIVSPLMGTLGTIAINKSESKKRYIIRVEVRTKGIAGVLTGKRRENYRSEGVREERILKSRLLYLERKTNRKRQIDEYRIDPVKKQVVKQRMRWKNGHPDRNSSKTLPFYSQEDLLTLTFNVFPKVLKEKSKKHWEILAVGAEKIKGKIMIDRLAGSLAEKEKKRLKAGAEDTMVVLSSPEKIGGKKNRRFVVAVDRQGIPRKLRFVAIPLVGEIFVERVNR